MPLFYGERFEENPVTAVGGPLAAGIQPTIALAAGAGSTATATFSANSTDRCGQITITCSGSSQAAGLLGTVTFATAFAKAPVVICSGYDQTTAAGPVVGTRATTTTTFTFGSTTAPTASDVIVVNYVVFGAGA